MAAEEIVDNRDRRRFEWAGDAGLAQLQYHVNGKRLTLVHTEVADELSGKGLGGRLVRAALARAAAEDLTIVPTCPFARRWMSEHPDELGDVTIDWSGFG